VSNISQMMQTGDYKENDEPNVGNRILNRQMEGLEMTHTWELQEGKVLVVEDADTASLVIVGKHLKDREDKITALEEVLQNMRGSTAKKEPQAKKL
jgi:bacterioferritin (cytochrome b1)